MTAEDRFVIGLNDLRVVRFECGTCGAAISFKTTAWSEIPMTCPGCHVQWHQGPYSDFFKTLNSLRVSLTGAIALGDQIGFSIRFELDRPQR